MTPADMGAYMCIAKNTVPPAQSKRVFVYVQCKKPTGRQPMIHDCNLSHFDVSYES